MTPPKRAEKTLGLLTVTHSFETHGGASNASRAISTGIWLLWDMKWPFAPNPLRAASQIGLAVGALMGKRKMGRHFELQIGQNSLSWRQNPRSIAQEAHLHGVYVVHSSVPADAMDADEVVQSYKDLARVERSFRCLKTVDLEIRPIRHWTADRVRAHIFLCMLAHPPRRPPGHWHRWRANSPMTSSLTSIAVMPNRQSQSAK